MGTKTKVLIATTFGLFAACIALVVGFWIAGADILGWFTTKWAIITYICIGFYFAFSIGYIVKDCLLGKK